MINFRTVGSATGLVLLLTGCASSLPSSQAGAPIIPESRQAAPALEPTHRALGCYGTFAVKVEPCPARLTKKNGGNVSVTVSGPGVALAAVIASDCDGNGSICNVVQTGYTQFDVTSVVGENPCGMGWVVFEGLTASLSPVGTATLKVVNKHC